MRNVYAILTGICLILLCTTCTQFTADIEDYLSYWSTEVAATDFTLDKPYISMGEMLYVSSAEDVTVTIKLRNPKKLTLKMPTSSDKVIRFPGLSTQPQYGIEKDYTLTQTTSNKLILTYKKDFLQAHEWGNGDIGAEITFIADDNRVFDKRFSMNLKADTPPALEYKGVGKTQADGKWYYVLIFQAQNMNAPLPSPLSHLHGDIKTLHITKESGESSVYTIQNINAAAKTFNWKPGDPLLMTAMQLEAGDYEGAAPNFPAATDKWLIYYKTDIEISPSSAAKTYTAQLSDAAGLRSNEVKCSTVKRKVGAINLVVTNPSSYIPQSGENGEQAYPYSIRCDEDGATLQATCNTPPGVTISYTVYDITSGTEAKKSEGSGASPLTGIRLITPGTVGQTKKYKVALKATALGFTEDTRDVYYTLTRAGGVTIDASTLNENEKWKKLREAVVNATEGDIITIKGEIKATNDSGNYDEIIIDKNLTIKGKNGAGTDILDANSSGPNAPATTHRIFKVENGKTLTLKNLTLKGGQCSGSTENGGAVSTKGGSVEMTLCTLIGNTANRGGAVYAEKDGSTAAAVTLKGCTIGGTETGNANAANTGSDREGGGIYIGEGCTLILEDSGATGCTVKGNNALRGGGIYVAGTAEIKGTSKILNNTADHFGGGIHSEGTLTLSGDALIKDNSASDHSALGGGVYVGNGTFTMSGRATVTPSTGENADKPRENDVYLANGKKITIPAALTGTAPVARITPATYAITTQVLTGSITAGTSPNQNYTKFTVTPQTLSDGKILYWEVDAAGKLMRIVDGVKYRDKAWKALKDVVSVAGADPITINGRIQATDDADNKGTININDHITIKGKNGRDTDILDAGKKGGRIFIINDTLTNKLTLEKLTLKGGFVNGNDGAAILVGRDAEAELSACTIEECEALNGGAIAILATGTATLTNTDIKNCSAKLFSGNTPPNGSGGAVYAAGGTVIMTNCTLTGNTAENNGGAVYAKKTSDLTPILSTVTIEGGTIGGAGTNANKATGTGEGLGGGIYIGESCVLNMKDYTDSSNNKHGAKVISNTAKAKGGAIYTKGGKVTMTNCTLKGNEAKSGGAICAEKDGSTPSNVTISGGTIGGTGADANKATGTDSDNGFGGAVFIKGAIVTLNGCTLEGNKAKNGGGVYMEGGNCTLNGSLKNNTTTELASSYGGGIYLENGTLTMKTGAEISGSEASVSGGGVYISARDGGTASFTMEGGTISGCKVSSAYFVDGGGVCVEGAHGSTGTANFIMQGGSITGCKAVSGGLTGSPSGGGVCVKNGATFNMTGGSITGCKAVINDNAGTPESRGGGVYMENSTFNMSGSSSITGCTAESSDSDISGSPSFYGGGVYAAGSTATFTMKDSAVITPSSEVPSGMKRSNDVYLNSDAKITVADTLSPEGGIAARITPAAYNTATQVLAAGAGVTLANETYKFAVTPQTSTAQPWTVGGNGYLKQGRYTEVPYGQLETYLANASSTEVNYIEVTGSIPAAHFKGTSGSPSSPPKPGALGQKIKSIYPKKVALKLPDGLSVTDMSTCFALCKNLISVENIPSGVTDMRACFYGCENLTTVPAIPATVRGMLECFRFCKSLTQCPDIPSSVTDMRYCFDNCTALTTAPNIPSGVESMVYCFNGCTSLTTVPNIPATVTRMAYCFNGCTGLTTAPDIPSSVSELKECFKNCTSLQRVKLNCNYRADKFNDAFKGCTALETGGIKVPSGQVTTYQNAASAMGTTRDKFAALP